MTSSPPMHLGDMPDLRRHLTKPVFHQTKILRKALCTVRKATSASTQFLPEYGMTVGEFCACRMIKKWQLDDATGLVLIKERQIAKEQCDAEGGRDVHK